MGRPPHLVHATCTLRDHDVDAQQLVRTDHTVNRSTYLCLIPLLRTQLSLPSQFDKGVLNEIPYQHHIHTGLSSVGRFCPLQRYSHVACTFSPLVSAPI